MRMLAALLIALSAPASAKKPAPGETAPAFALPSSTGKTIKLADYAGKTVVLAFFPKAFTGG